MKKIELDIKIITVFTFFLFINNNLIGSEAYFDLSEKEIQIQTDFDGKTIIIFGTFQLGEDTIISIQGPKKDTSVLKKEKILGFWFNTKKIIYKELPSLFFIASSSPIKEILNSDTIVKEKLHFDDLLTNAVTQRNFIEQKNLKNWNKNLINIKKRENLYKQYVFKNIDNKLFQTRVFFPSNSIPGKYDVTIYQVKNKLLLNKKSNSINIRKSGIGEKIYIFAHENSLAYGLLSVIFAIFSGLIAATAFRRL